MGVNDAREQLEVCKDEYTKLEAQINAAESVIQRIEMHLEDYADEPALIYVDEVIGRYREEYPE